MVKMLSDLTVGIFVHLDIMPNTGIDPMINHTDCILTGPAPKKYRAMLLVCKEAEKSYSRDQWKLGEAKDVIMEDF